MNQVKALCHEGTKGGRGIILLMLNPSARCVWMFTNRLSSLFIREGRTTTVPIMQEASWVPTSVSMDVGKKNALLSMRFEP
jgi:hypothetical protein